MAKKAQIGRLVNFMVVGEGSLVLWRPYNHIKQRSGKISIDSTLSFLRLKFLSLTLRIGLRGEVIPDFVSAYHPQDELALSQSD